MGIHLHLKDRQGKTVVTINDAPSESVRCGVVLHRGDYYTYLKMDLILSELHIIFALTDILEINV